jgi:hypothetical protein
LWISVSVGAVGGGRPSRVRRGLADPESVAAAGRAIIRYRRFSAVIR